MFVSTHIKLCIIVQSYIFFVAVFFFSNILRYRSHCILFFAMYVCAVKRKQKCILVIVTIVLLLAVHRCFLECTLQYLVVLVSVALLSFSCCPSSPSSSSLYSTSIHNLSFGLMFFSSSFVHIFFPFHPQN